MSRNRVYWFAQRNTPEGEQDKAGGRKRELLELFHDWHDPIPVVIEATDEAHILRNDIYQTKPLHHWSRGRVTLLGDAAALKEQLEARRTGLLAQLEHGRYGCELAVTALWTAADEPSQSAEATTPGRRYLLERKLALANSERRHARALEVADTIERELGQDVVDVRHQMCPSPAVALSLALLIKRARAEDIQRRLRGRIEPGVRILVNGPWPPYTFAGVSSEPA